MSLICRNAGAIDACGARQAMRPRERLGSPILRRWCVRGGARASFRREPRAVCDGPAGLDQGLKKEVQHVPSLTV